MCIFVARDLWIFVGLSSPDDRRREHMMFFFDFYLSGRLLCVPRLQQHYRSQDTLSRICGTPEN
jgi:hypothetical protein